MKTLRINSIFTFRDCFVTLSKNLAVENHIFNIRMLKRMTDLIWRDEHIEATLLFYVLSTASKDS